MRPEALAFDVVGQDVSGITVKLVKGASLTGVVVLEALPKCYGLSVKTIGPITT